MDQQVTKTLYINNINEKVSLDVLKKMFYMVFSQYGRVADIVAYKSVKLRGQAWVVFNDVASATAAMRGKQGFNFYGKQLRIQYAKDKSSGTGTATTGGRETSGGPLKRKREGDTSETSSKVAKVVTSDVPNHLLIAHGLPPGMDNETLQTLFQQCVGYQEVRSIPGDPTIGKKEYEISSSKRHNHLISPDQCTFSTQHILSIHLINSTYPLNTPSPHIFIVAFVEFGDETQAGMALKQLEGFQLTQNEVLHLTYGK